MILPSWRTDRRKTAERGYGGRWQAARLRFLQANPLCLYCEKRGLVTAASVVDHRIPHKGNDTLFWDEANWQPLCKTCHDEDKAAEEGRRALRPQIGPDGYPIGDQPTPRG